MKVLAARRRDAEDIRFLVDHLKLHNADAVVALCAQVFPEEPVPDRARMISERSGAGRLGRGRSYDGGHD
ncbi:hypothetical protein ACGFJ7_30670 [Actinoplanes sp. NPDC048988]|uniref:hypothetical protein n=1 Tax=Actinoplanes sp. NPDC048988 TaxID=3363901 RepID=UPI003713B8DC